MLYGDLALLGPPFQPFVDQLATDQNAFFAAFTEAWVTLQENGAGIFFRPELESGASTHTNTRTSIKFAA